MKKLFISAIIAMSALGSSFALAQDSTLFVSKGKPNPKGNVDEVYLLKGDNLDGTITINGAKKLPKESKKRDTVLRIYHLNDLHGNVMSYSKKGDTYNLAQMKKTVDTAKDNADKNTSILWVSAGDDHIGSKLDELLGNSPETFVMSAPYEALSQAGLDFATLGNHEFDKYTPILVKAIDNNADFPVISSNIFGSKYDLNTSVAAIAVVDGIRIGIIGLTIPEETNLETMVDSTIHAIDPMEAVEKLIPVIDDYSDFIMVLSHNGYEISDRYTLDKGEGAIAKKVGELTKKPAVVIGGHTHTLINKDGLEESSVYNGVPVVQAGQYGKYLGEFNADFSKKKTVYDARIIETLSGVANSNGVSKQSEKVYDEEFQEKVIEPMNVAVDGIMSKPIGKTDKTPLVAKEVNIVDRYVGESAMANYFNDAIVKRSKNFSTGAVDFSIFNSTGIGGLAVNSDITYNDLYSLFPYADTISVVEVTGQDLKDIIENNALRIIDKDKLSINGGTLNAAGFIETGYLNFSSGIRYEIKDGKSVNITLNGEDIDKVLNKKYKLAISTYLVIGRGGWQGTAVGQGLPEDFIGYNLKKLCSENSLDLGILFRSEIAEYIMDDSKGLIGKSTGVVKDGRIKVIN